MRGKTPLQPRTAEGAHHWQCSAVCRENRAHSKTRHPSVVFFWKHCGLSTLLTTVSFFEVTRYFKVSFSYLFFSSTGVFNIIKKIKYIYIKKQASKRVYNDADILCFTQWTTETELSTKLFISLIITFWFCMSEISGLFAVFSKWNLQALFFIHCEF